MATPFGIHNRLGSALASFILSFLAVAAAAAQPSAAGPNFRAAELIQAVNQYGLQNHQYRPARVPPPAFISTGTLISLTPEGSSLPNNMGVYVYGSRPDEFDEVRFKLNLNDVSFSREAIAVYSRIVTRVCNRLQLPLSSDALKAIGSQTSRQWQTKGEQIEVRYERFLSGRGESYNVILARA